MNCNEDKTKENWYALAISIIAKKSSTESINIMRVACEGDKK